MTSALEDLLVRQLDAGTIPGAIGLLGWPDAEPEVVAVGNLAEDAIVRIQSMTKAVTGVAALPLDFQPGEGWRYHHSCGILGILISRLTGRPVGDHLRDDLFEPLGMPDTGYWVPAEKTDRLPAAYR